MKRNLDRLQLGVLKKIKKNSVGTMVQLPNASLQMRPPPGIPHQAVTVQPDVSPNQRYNGNPTMPVQVKYIITCCISDRT